MKIAIVSPVYPPYRGGMGAVAAQDVADLAARGVAATVFVPRYPGQSAPPSATALRPWWAIGNGAVLPQLLWRLRKFEVVHLHYPFYGTDIFVALSCFLFRIPLVVTYHMVAKAPDYRQYIFSLHRRLCEPVILQIARRVLISSFDYAQAIGVRHRQLIERPLGVDTQRFAPGHRQAARQQWQLTEQDKVIVFVGGLDRAHFFKGVPALLASLVHLSDISWQLFVVGEGDLKAEYQALAEKLGLADRIRFLGNVTAQDLPSVYAAADVHVLPSTGMNEAFGLVTLEAAASGIPSVVSDLPGVRSVVVAHATGLLVPPGDSDALAAALERLLTDDDMRQRLGRAARARAEERYSSARLAEDLLPLYKQITSPQTTF